MIPNRELAAVRPVKNPALVAIAHCVEAKRFAGRPITAGLLDEVSAALTKATRTPYIAFHEVDLVPPEAGMVRVRMQHDGGPWVLRAFRSPGRQS